ncbi:TonB-dependent receptor plug domain-containing protein [Pseudomonas sp. HK3]
MSISVASKRSEAVSQAPGVISIITREHIRRFGGLNLGDLIDRLANTQVMGSSLYPRNRSSVRAVSQTHIDDKVLILLDGRPLRDAGQGGVNGDLYATFPIETIEQIEIIRGPGSVLYGTNAFSGVFNIVTRSSNSPHVSGLIRAGSDSDKKVSLSAGQEFDHGSIHVNAQLIEHPSAPYHNIAGEVGENGDHDMGYDSEFFHLNGNFGSLNFSALISNTRIDSANNLQSYPSDDWDIERRFFDIGHAFNLSAASDWHLNLTINQMENKALIFSQSVGTPDDFFVTDSTSYLLDTYIQTTLSDNTSLITGASYDYLLGDNVSAGTLNTDIDTWRATYYGQINHKLSQAGRIIAGAQFNSTKEHNEGFSPRIMYIHTVNKQHSFKLGYDEAYRSPFGLDLFLKAGFLEGDDNLEPETIQTWTLQHIFNAHDFRLASTLYINHHEHLIVRDEAQSPVKLKNAGHVDYAGVEFEYNWNINAQWRLEGNASYQQNESDTGQKDTGIAPNIMIKQGISAQWASRQFGLYASYFGEPTQPVDLNPNVAVVNPSPNSYVLATVQFKQSLEPWLKTKGWSLSVYVDNLLDEAVYYPEFGRKQVNSFPFRERRAIYFTFDYAP